MFSDHQPVREISAGELDRRAAGVLGEVAAGTRVIVTKYGRAIAVIVSIDDANDLLLGGSERFALLRREAREALQRHTLTELADLDLGESIWDSGDA